MAAKTTTPAPTQGQPLSQPIPSAAENQETAPIVCGFNSNMFAVAMSRAQDIATAWEKIAAICGEFQHPAPTPEELAAPDYIKTLADTIAEEQAKKWGNHNPYTEDDIRERVRDNVSTKLQADPIPALGQAAAKYVKIDGSGTASIDEELCIDDCKIILQGEPAAKYRQIQKACDMINEALEQIAPIGNYLESIDKYGRYQVRPSTLIYWPYVLK